MYFSPPWAKCEEIALSLDGSCAGLTEAQAPSISVSTLYFVSSLQFALFNMDAGAQVQFPYFKQGAESERARMSTAQLFLSLLRGP